MEYLFVLSAVFSLLFFLLLISKKNKRQEHWFLGSIFLLITINSIFVFLLSKSDASFYIPFFSELNYAIPMLYGPLFWFYTKSLVHSEFTFGKKYFWHFIPFIVFLIIMLFPMVSSIQLPESNLIGYPLAKLIVTPLYLFPVLVMLNRYRKNILNHVSNTDKVNLIWMDWITVGAISLWLIAVGGYIYNQFALEPQPVITDYLILAFLALYLFALAFIAFTKTDLFKLENVRYAETHSLEDEEKVLVKEESNTTENYSENLEKLITLMEEEKPFLDPQLTLYRLSEIARIPQYKISKALNEQLNQNFFEFVNQYRVEHVKMMLKEGKSKQLNLLGVAMESGFNSKASFNRIFKKLAGQTPSQYLKSLD